ncbi:MAG: DUF2608 domain-containing protein [Alphaproteobacteria bacterium]|nr:DUF2608 domain-containing protein [Alphaproteobacteria bacterium]
MGRTDGKIGEIVIRGLISRFLLTLFLCFCSYTVNAKMVSIKSLKDVQPYVDEAFKDSAPEEILIAFDIDMTLTQPDHPVTYYPHLKQHIDSYKEITSSLSGLEKDFLLTALTQNLPQRLIEEDTPLIIKNLQLKGIKTIAFTAVLEKIFDNKNIKQIRFKTLNSYNISFEGSFDFKEITLKEISAYNHHHPSYYKGILFSNGENGSHNKGIVLIEFLKYLPKLPSTIIIVDDKKRNLQEIEHALKHSYPHIEFIGIEYQGAFDYAPKPISKKEFEDFWNERVKQTRFQSIHNC